jgi:hypothetical protein
MAWWAWWPRFDEGCDDDRLYELEREIDQHVRGADAFERCWQRERLISVAREREVVELGDRFVAVSDERDRLLLALFELKARYPDDRRIDEAIAGSPSTAPVPPEWKRA